ncbi:MAG TPA: thioredoxin family protein [Candidatus Dormibacteraeota bacterium]|jgi:thioredoxin 1|nr:thioredoxin family protein [Candidatus Dormibacteraeota bacterium]
METTKVSSIIDVDSTNWDDQVAKSKQLVLVDFWHDSCVWCKRLDPELSTLAGEFTGKLKFAKLNIFSSDGNAEIGRKYGIMGTPTLLIFCNGRPVDSLVGYRPRDVLRKELREKVDKAKDCFKQSTSL